MFFARELDYVKSQSYDVEYPEFTALKLFPVSSEINPGAETVTYYSYDKVSIATLARTAALAFALANQVSSAAGKPLLPIESSEVEQFVTTGLTIATSVAAWWKNNSFTAAAIEGDKRMNSLKNQVH